MLLSEKKKKVLYLLVGWVHDSGQKIVSKRIKPYKSEMRCECVQIINKKDKVKS